nr:hypothetical protein [uncultured Albidiferax sp.]
MKKIWAFVSQPQNLAVLVALAGGLGFLWKDILATKPPPKMEMPPSVAQQATANDGIAINASGSAQVVVGHPPAPTAAP